MMKFVVLILAVLSLTACDQEPDKKAEERVICQNGKFVSAEFNGIIGGEVVREDSWIAKKVVFLIIGGKMACTGTLIDRDIVLTAAHCVEAGGQKDVSVAYSAQPECDMISGKLRQENVGQSVAVRKHPSYGSRNNSGDIALVKLDRPAPADYQTVTLTATDAYDRGLQGGQSVLLAGYGRTTPEGDPNVGLMLKGTVLRVVGQNSVGIMKQRLLDTFTQSGSVLSYATQKRVDEVFQVRKNGEFLLLDQSEGTGICMGDSGGPTFIREGSRILQTAVSTETIDGKGGLCQFMASNTNVKYHRAWIEKTYKELKKGKVRKNLFQ